MTMSAPSLLDEMIARLEAELPEEAPLTEVDLERIRDLDLTSCDFCGGGCVDADCYHCYASLRPETVSIEVRNEALDQLRAENLRLSKVFVEGVKTHRDLLSKVGDALFVDGYDQAVREIRDHFKKASQDEVAAEVEKIWRKGPAS